MARTGRTSLRESAIGQFASLHHEHESYRWWVLANVMIGTFMAVLDATIVNVALPKIMAAFGVSVDKVEWILTAYLLVFAVMLPTSGWVADHFGYKRTYFVALFLFTFGSFLCGVAWDENVLILFRIIQGMGAGFLMPVGMAIVTREFPVEKRGVALGFWSIAAAASVSLGPLIGGYLIDNFSWHMIFDVNVPVGLLGMFATFVIQREYRTEHARSFDLIGFISGSTFLTCLLLALADGNAAWNTGGWTSPFILTCFVLSAIGLVVFLIVELNIEHPLIELALLKDFNFGVTNVILFIFGLGMFGSTFLLPLYLQNSLGYTAYQVDQADGNGFVAPGPSQMRQRCLQARIVPQCLIVRRPAEATRAPVDENPAVKEQWQFVRFGAGVDSAGRRIIGVPSRRHHLEPAQAQVHHTPLDLLHGPRQGRIDDAKAGQPIPMPPHQRSDVLVGGLQRVAVMQAVGLVEERRQNTGQVHAGCVQALQNLARCLTP